MMTLRLLPASEFLRSAHREPHSRAGARDRKTAVGPGPAAAGGAEPLPNGLSEVSRRIRTKGVPSRVNTAAKATISFKAFLQ
jgi:hypothetical protein